MLSPSAMSGKVCFVLNLRVEGFRIEGFRVEAFGA